MAGERYAEIVAQRDKILSANAEFQTYAKWEISEFKAHTTEYMTTKAFEV